MQRGMLAIGGEPGAPPGAGDEAPTWLIVDSTVERAEGSEDSATIRALGRAGSTPGKPHSAVWSFARRVSANPKLISKGALRYLERVLCAVSWNESDASDSSATRACLYRQT